MNNYISIPLEFEEQFNISFKHRQILFFTAPCGYGKTAVAKKLLRNKDVKYEDASSALFLQSKKEEKTNILVIDNLESLEEDKHKNAILEIIYKRIYNSIIFISMGEVPSWLFSFQLDGIMEVFTSRYFTLDEYSIKSILTSYKLSLSSTEIKSIFNETAGYPVFVAILCKVLVEEKRYSENALNIAKRRLFTYLDEAFFAPLERVEKKLLLCLAPFTTFTNEFVQMISGDVEATKTIEKLQRNKTIIQVFVHDELMLIPIFNNYLIWKSQQNMDIKGIKTLYSRAGLYYELRGNFDTAIEYYAKADEKHNIAEVLIKNVEKQVSAGLYYDLEKYYLKMSEEEIISSPTLMAGMSMVNSLIADYEKSEYWYNKMKELENSLPPNSADYKEVRRRRVFLDISLKQRSADLLLAAVKEGYDLIVEDNILLPEVSVTNGIPSILNGGKDLSILTDKTYEIATGMGEMIEKGLARNGIGLIDCVVCEINFERGEDYKEKLLEVMSKISEIQRKGSFEIEFAVGGILIRSYIESGQVNEAYEALDSVKSRFENIGDKRFIPNIEALRCRIKLLEGDDAFCNEWLSESMLQENYHMWAILKYRFFTKIMVEISNENYDNALISLARLLPYMKQCERKLDVIYGYVLTAICHYKMNNDKWIDEFNDVLNIVYEYKYIRPIAEYGAAILPLLSACKWNKDKAFLNKIINLARVYAVNYPKFLKPQSKLITDLTLSEEQVLKLICNNLSNQEIADVLGIKMPTVKTHVRNILAKLQVKRRNEAKDLAEKLKLV